MEYDKIAFKGHSGEKLSARLDKPEGEVKAYALFAHCFTCGKDILAASRIASELSKKGYAVLRFDFTGLGMSEGEFANTNFSSNVQDLIKAADFMRANLEAPKILIGHSLGGAAVLAAAGSIDEVEAVATIGAPADIEHITHHFKSHEQEILEKGEAEVQLAGRPFKIKKQFVEDVKKQNLRASIEKLNRALLVMHAPLDETVSIENAGKIFSAAKHPKSFMSLDTANHLISNRKDAAYAAQIIASWAERYI